MLLDQCYVIVVDIKCFCLYFYENDQVNGGWLCFVVDYYVIQGKLGVEKLVEGDKKILVGVYYVIVNLFW